MSLLQSTVLYVFPLVSCAFSYTFAMPTEVTEVTEVVQVYDFYHIIMSALLQRATEDYNDEEPKNTRVKKTTADMGEAVKMSPDKLFNLFLLTFRNMFSTKPIDGDPPLKPDDAALTIATMIQKGLAKLKEKKSKS